jgi:hypothetical protein
MTQLKTLECLIAHVKEIRKRYSKDKFILKRTCRQSCDNPSLCNELLTTCNAFGFSGRDFGWKKSDP